MPLAPEDFFAALVLGRDEPDGPLGRIGRRHQLVDRVDELAKLRAGVAAEGVVAERQALGLVLEFGPRRLAKSACTALACFSLTRLAQHGLPTGTTLGGLSTTQTYNGFGEPEHFSASHAGSEIYSLQLGYDRDGRITTKTEVVQGQSTASEYGYDAAGRLAEVRHNGSVVASYGYDANGNRTQINGATVASLDEQDRLQSHGDASYTHGAAGERTGKTQGGQSTAYGYDIHGNLKNVSLPDGRQISYPTDARHRRIGKRVDGTLTRRWLYQGELRIAAELDAGGAVSTRFVYGLKANVPEYMVKGAATYRLITDHLGSVRLVVDSATGEVAQRMDYDEWGKVTADTNPGFQPFGYAGGLYDPDTGLVRFGTRDYDAGTGRWTAKDPIGFGGGDANLYSYVEGNPISLTDPTGECPWCVAAGIGALTDLAVQLYFNGFNLKCVNWKEVAISGAAAGLGVGIAQKLGKVSTVFGGHNRPTYRFFQSKGSVRVESHPTSRNALDWHSYPHWHPDFAGKPWSKMHWPLVEPLIGLPAAAYNAAKDDCECQK